MKSTLTPRTYARKLRLLAVRLQDLRDDARSAVSDLGICRTNDVEETLDIAAQSVLRAADQAVNFQRS